MKGTQQSAPAAPAAAAASAAAAALPAPYQTLLFQSLADAASPLATQPAGGAGKGQKAGAREEGGRSRGGGCEGAVASMAWMLRSFCRAVARQRMLAAAGERGERGGRGE
jgi:hypothetical protein